MSEPGIGAPATPAIRRIDAREAEARLDELAAILTDAVAHGASVNFLAGMTEAQALGFWRGQLAGISAGERVLLVAEQEGRLIGTVVLTHAPQPNAPHRAEIGKMLVHSAHRRQGLGRRLLEAAEHAALASGRTLLMLDTETGSAGDLLYRACGWTEMGIVPDHSFNTHGKPAPTTFFYKALAAHRLPGGAIQTRSEMAIAARHPALMARESSR
jgi:GNAT superfamily N-acetyltransferase